MIISSSTKNRKVSVLFLVLFFFIKNATTVVAVSFTQWRFRPIVYSNKKNEHSSHERHNKSHNLTSPPALPLQKWRGGDRRRSPTPTTLKQTPLLLLSSSVLQLITSAIFTILPPTLSIFREIIHIYTKLLPTDFILAQTGLVYCFAGGYYPTLFAAVQAARTCGWDDMVRAVVDLTDEAAVAIESVKEEEEEEDIDADVGSQTRKIVFTKTLAVMKAVDPVKINTAVASLYATYAGVTSALSREFARTITLSITIADALHPLSQYVLVPTISAFTPPDYQRWIPVVLGWGCKAVAMSLAWRAQRVLSAGASAVVGGLMFSRAVGRLLRKRWGVEKEGGGGQMTVVIDDLMGYTIAAVGLNSQIKSQWKSGFSFEVPYPLCLVTWPFDVVERWLQWQITKR